MAVSSLHEKFAVGLQSLHGKRTGYRRRRCCFLSRCGCFSRCCCSGRCLRILRRCLCSAACCHRQGQCSCQQETACSINRVSLFLSVILLAVLVVIRSGRSRRLFFLYPCIKPMPECFFRYRLQQKVVYAQPERMQGKIQLAAPYNARFREKRPQVLHCIQPIHARKGNYSVGRRILRATSKNTSCPR